MIPDSDKRVEAISRIKQRILDHSHVTDPEVAYEIAREWVNS